MKFCTVQSSECIASAKGIVQVGLNTGVYGVITTDTIEQAIARAGTKSGNKGATVTAIKMASLDRQIDRVN